jgi:UDP-glucose 4-epimerase
LKTVLVTGSEGFLGRYIVREFVAHGWRVIGVDNRSRSAADLFAPDGYELVEMDAQDLREDVRINSADFDVIVAGAALVGGIEYFHAKPYDLLATNERITAATFDLAIDRWHRKLLNRIVAISSSMVFERARKFPTPEEEVDRCPPPASTYGFQKLAVEYFCKGAHEQYGLPYVILRPFNCVGPGEGGVEMAHVLPDLVRKAFDAEEDGVLSIYGNGKQVRCYTHGRDIARAVRLAAESDAALGHAFNISHGEAMTVRRLAQIVWAEVYGEDATPMFHHDEALTYDVKRRWPDVSKAAKILGFTAEVDITEAVREVVAEERSRRAGGPR